MVPFCIVLVLVELWLAFVSCDLLGCPPNRDWEVSTMRKALLAASAVAVAVCGFGFSIAGATPTPPTTSCLPEIPHEKTLDIPPTTIECPPPTTEAPPETTTPSETTTPAEQQVATPAAAVVSTPRFTG